jgi:hypothetical protein
VKASNVELGATVEEENAVLFLEYIGQLGVAVAKHVLIVQKHIAQPLEARQAGRDGRCGRRWLELSENRVRKRHADAGVQHRHGPWWERPERWVRQDQS